MLCFHGIYILVSRDRQYMKKKKYLPTQLIAREEIKQYQRTLIEESFFRYRLNQGTIFQMTSEVTIFQMMFEVRRSQLWEFWAETAVYMRAGDGNKVSLFQEPKSNSVWPKGSDQRRESQEMKLERQVGPCRLGFSVKSHSLVLVVDLAVLIT